MIRKSEDKQKYKSITWSVLFYIAWRNMFSKKLRSILTASGVVIGVSAVFFLLTFGLGIQELVTKEVIGSNSLKVIDVTSPNSKIISVDSKAVNAILTYPHVKAIGTEYSFPGIIQYSGGEVDSVVYGVNQTHQDLSNFLYISGRALDKSDSRSIVVNTAALESIGIFDWGSAINKQLTITIPLQHVSAGDDQVKDEFVIVGVIDSSSSPEVFIPSSILEIAGVVNYSQLKVVIDDVKNVSTAREQIESSGFETSSLTDTLVDINNIFKFFTITVIGLGGVGMLVAVLGMFNTMTISLIERTKEIGLMVAIGARRKDMRQLFVIEAVMISLFGAIVGILWAVFLSRLVNFYININAQTRGVTENLELFYMPLWSFVVTIFFTVLIGFLVVLLPARRAERINPIDALRRD